MSITPQFGTIKPSQAQQTLSDNYLSFDSDAGGGTFAQQYLPEIYEQEVERYGNRTLSGFLRMVGAEMPMTSDQVIWSEQNRLHVAYDDVTVTNGTTLTIGNLSATAGPDFVQNVLSANQTLVVIDPVTGKEAKVIVTATPAGPGTAAIAVATYGSADLVTANGAGNPAPFTAAAKVKIFVYGSEYQKGSTLVGDNYASIEPSFTQFANSPIIIRNQYVVSGSDMAQIGWVEVATEDGTSGFLWYLKAESETRLRFADYLEMSVVEGKKVIAGDGVAGYNALLSGTQGLFEAIEDRGNVQTGFTAAAGLDDFDAILKNLDTQGAIEENMLFLNRQTALDFDDMLGAISAGQAGGTAFGLFENSEEMALNLGFSGFRRGSYDFYKTDWKYLNDASTRGGLDYTIQGIEGVLVPAGTSTVYDQILGTNIRRPFLHVRYRASQADDRRMKSWLTGSAGGAFTSDLDAMQVNFLSERCLCVQAANNFVLFKGA
tara:strand:- start:5850 stop:7316 length:1467 start_codon:yes stop_codon:yes gene_type:complete